MVRFRDKVPFALLNKSRAFSLLAATALSCAAAGQALAAPYIDGKLQGKIGVEYVGVAGMMFNASVWGKRYADKIQHVSITISAGATSNTATIASVDTAKSFVIFLGHTSNLAADQNDRSSPRVSLTNSTTVTAQRNTADGVSTTVVSAVVISTTHYLVESIQQGTVAVTSSTSGTATITSVDTTRSAVFYLGNTGTDSAASVPRRYAVTLTNATTVTANSNSSASATVGFVVVQFRAAVIKSRQQFSNAFTTSNSTDNQAISSVTVANCMIAYGGNISGGTGNYAIQITTSTNVQLTRVATSTASRTPRYTVIEFQPGVLRSSFRTQVSLQGQNGLAAFLANDVNNVKSFVNFTGWYFTSTDTANLRYSTVSFTGGSVDTGEVDLGDLIAVSLPSSSATAKGMAYEVIEFM